MTYCIDTSSLIHGWWEAYPPASFPTFWTNLEGLIASGKLVAPEEVLNELEQKSDALKTWAQGQSKFFQPLGAALAGQLNVIGAAHPAFVKSNGVGTGTSYADPFVVALAQLQSRKVVSEEGQGKKSAPSISDVCKAMNTPCIKLVALIVECGWKF